MEVDFVRCHVCEFVNGAVQTAHLSSKVVDICKIEEYTFDNDRHPFLLLLLSTADRSLSEKPHTSAVEFMARMFCARFSLTVLVEITKRTV